MTFFVKSIKGVASDPIKNSPLPRPTTKGEPSLAETIKFGSFFEMTAIA